MQACYLLVEQADGAGGWHAWHSAPCTAHPVHMHDAVQHCRCASKTLHDPLHCRSVMLSCDAPRFSKADTQVLVSVAGTPLCVAGIL